MINTAGHRLSTGQIEEIISYHHDVAECAVIGLPDPEWGERVVAFIVGRTGEAVEPGELKAFLKSRLSAFKVPKEFRTVAELPKSPAGKILKRRIRDEVKK